MIQGREENGKLIISIKGMIDSTNAPKVEAGIRELRAAHPCDSIDLDCDQLPYSTSAGLRIILRLIQETNHLALINVHSELYEILDITGFTEMTEVRKAYRVFSVENCEVIGQGANGKVYRIDPDTIIKVYRNPDALPEIHRERELARLAFVAGVPTAIPYDVVRIEGGGYGSVFELLNAKTFAQLLILGEKTPDEIAEMSTALLKLIHSKEIKSDILPNMKMVALGWADFLKDYLSAELFEKLLALVSAVPEDNHLIHGDYHIKNIMLQNGESLLIDMDTLSHGHPIFELASMYNAFEGYRLADPNTLNDFFGISNEICGQLLRRIMELYLGTDDANRVNETLEKAKVIGLARIMRRSIRRGGLNQDDGRKLIGICRDTLAELLPRIDSLVF